ncbi:MAG: hypothetical protein RLY62_188 [Actinomycetota bacterium]
MKIALAFSLAHQRLNSWRSERDLNPCSGICSPEPRLSAIRPSFVIKKKYKIVVGGADDRVRTGDLNLGKVPRYQLRYVRILQRVKSIALCHCAHNCNLFNLKLPLAVAFKHGQLQLNLLDGRSASNRVC